MEECTLSQEELIPPKVWAIEFNLRAIGKGCALVKASNAASANQILISSGMYNGNPSDYLITKTEEVDTPPCCGLMAELIIGYNEHG